MEIALLEIQGREHGFGFVTHFPSPEAIRLKEIIRQPIKIIGTMHRWVTVTRWDKRGDSRIRHAFMIRKFTT